MIRLVLVAIVGVLVSGCGFWENRPVVGSYVSTSGSSTFPQLPQTSPPVAQASPVVPQGPSGIAPVGAPGSECIDLKDGRSCDPRTSLGQSPLSVPMYRDTGVGKREVFQIPNIPAEYTLIAGGVRVNGYNQGSISAWVGPSQAMTLDITDGFYHIVVSNQAEGETCARVAQHIRENWLLTRLNVPPQWRSNCPAIASLLK